LSARHKHDFKHLLCKHLSSARQQITRLWKLIATIRLADLWTKSEILMFLVLTSGPRDVPRSTAMMGLHCSAYPK